jgi:hypothetical protein
MTRDATKMPLSFQLHSAKIVLSILAKNIGVKACAGVLFDMARRAVLGEPWKGQARPQDTKERFSREQSGPAVLLYRALLSKVSNDRAIEITGEIIMEASILFLRAQIPVMQPNLLSTMSEKEREKYILNIADQFYNADLGRVEFTEDSFSYEIVRCRFPELMKTVGHPELAPLFCAGDAVFFDREQPHIDFSRTHTLSADAKPCDFSFQIRK